MRVAILSSGRFHVLDLARELDAAGVTVSFISPLPASRAARFGLPTRAHQGILGAVAPALASRAFLRKGRYGSVGDNLLGTSVDRAGRARLPDCDVFVGMSGMSNRTAAAARSRGARVVIERGSRHMLSQLMLLSRSSSMGRATSVALMRELESYQLADRVSVPAKHVGRSFVDLGFPETSLMRIPYGTDTKVFKPVESPHRSVRPRILFVGTWCRRKGSDTLVEAWKQMRDCELWHVGAVGDLPLPTDEGFTHLDAVDQLQLPGHYAAADVFALPSREEGFALVLLQAAACGTRIVASSVSGAEDLRELLPRAGAVRIHEPEDSLALREGLEAAVADARAANGGRLALSPAEVESLSWQRYGKAYLASLQGLVASAPPVTDRNVP